MLKMSKTSVWDLPRNDIAACKKFWTEHPGMTPDQWRVMLQLQDDPAVLVEMSKTWKTAGTGKKSL